MTKPLLTVALAVAVVGVSLLGYITSTVQAAPPGLATVAEVTVAISGDVTLGTTGLTLQVGAQAQGPTTALVGQGFDTTFFGNAGGLPPGTCIFSLTGGRSLW